MRQWVLSLPFALRYRPAYDAPLTGEVLRRAVEDLLAVAADCHPGLGSSW